MASICYCAFAIAGVLVMDAMRPLLRLFCGRGTVFRVFWGYSASPVRDRGANVTHYNLRYTCCAFWAGDRPRVLCDKGVGGPNVFVCLFVMDALRPLLRLLCGRGTGFGVIAPPLLEIGGPK